MPDIGLVEIIVIGIAMFLILGPERTPEFMGQIARWLRKAKSWFGDVREQLRREVDTVQDPIVQAREMAKGEIQAATDEVNASLAGQSGPAAGNRAGVRPLSEIYQEMQEGRDDDTSQGFMQGFKAQKADDDEGMPPEAGDSVKQDEKQHG